MDHPELPRTGVSPAILLAAGVVVSLTLLCLPPTWFSAVRGHLRGALRPAQIGAGSLRSGVAKISDRLDAHLNSVRRQMELETNKARLEAENRRLQAELSIARASASRNSDTNTASLLRAGCVPARVLGRAAREFLASQRILDVGARSGLRADALVVAGPRTILDQGAAAGLLAEQLVFSEGRLWGKIVEVGSQTSIVRTVTEPGFRDLVRLAPAAGDGEPIRLGPSGILEGTGEPLARIRRVEVTVPVSVGDGVYTLAGQGVLPRPLLYGRIVRVERPVGAAHWDLWMKPALQEEPETVVVLRVEVNRERVANDQ